MSANFGCAQTGGSNHQYYYRYIKDKIDFRQNPTKYQKAQTSHIHALFHGFFYQLFQQQEKTNKSFANTLECNERRHLMAGTISTKSGYFWKTLFWEVFLLENNF